MSSTFSQKMRHAVQLFAMTWETVQIGVTVVTAPSGIIPIESMLPQHTDSVYQRERKRLAFHTNLAEQE